MKSEKGITIISLIVTIVIMAIISSTVLYTANGIDEDIDDDVLIAELKTVHHIVLQEYNKKLTLGEEYRLKGTQLTTSDELQDHKTSLGIEKFQTTFDKYYKLTQENLNQIGAKNATSEYLVCYETGEVANIIEYKTSNGEPLYTK